MPAPTLKLTPREAAVLGALTRAADDGMPCPSSSALSRMLGYKSTCTSSGVTKALIRKGYISIESGDCWREATILATGRRTARGNAVTSGGPPATKVAQPEPVEYAHPIYVDPDTVIREGRNLSSVSLKRWMAAHAQAYA